MKNTRKLNKGLKISGKVLCTFFVCYFVLVSCSVFNAFLNIEEKYKSINADKHQLIDLVVNTDKNKNYDIKDKLMKEYSLKMIYDYSNDGDVDVKYEKDCNTVTLSVDEDDPDMLYKSTIFTKSIDDNSYFTWKDFTEFKRGTTLKDFMKTEISHQAYWVSKDETGYSFDYYIENIDDEYRGMEKLTDVHLEFDKNGLLTYNSLLAESMYYDFIK